ncbi:MAG: thioredoxin [Bacteroidetes bacterium]|nr:thioredoxin [Bacteroidota bacterium]
MSKFNDILKKDIPTLIDFYATWCGPCKMVHPILDDLKKQIGDKITILKIDIDKNPNVTDQFKIRSVPSLMLFKGGETLWRESGVIPVNTLLNKIQPHL